MSNLKIIPFRKDIVLDFNYDGVEKDLAQINVADIAEFYASLGTAFVGLIDDRVIGLGGVYPLWKNWGAAWLFLNKEASNHTICIFKCIVNRMDELIKKYDISILSVQCMDNSIEANRLLSHLGFFKDNEIKMATYKRIRRDL